MNVVLCNCSPGESGRLAAVLVEEGLVACVNVIAGVRSVYMWQGKVCDEVEDTLLIKVGAHGVDALANRIRELHSYDTVEIVVLPVDDAQSDPRYVAWVNANTRT
jgi:periplasmic divalent cation tolerance protein